MLEKKSFIVYQSWRAGFELLTESEKAQFITNLFRFNSGEEIILDTPMLNMFWKTIEFNLTENDKRYKTSVENGSKGGAPKGNQNAKKQPKQPNSTDKQPNQLSVEQNKLNVNVNDNVNDNVNENEKVNVKDNDKNIAEKRLTDIVETMSYDYDAARKLLKALEEDYKTLDKCLDILTDDNSVKQNYKRHFFNLTI